MGLATSELPVIRFTFSRFLYFILASSATSMMFSDDLVLIFEVVVCIRCLIDLSFPGFFCGLLTLLCFCFGLVRMKMFGTKSYPFLLPIPSFLIFQEVFGNFEKINVNCLTIGLMTHSITSQLDLFCLSISIIGIIASN